MKVLLFCGGLGMRMRTDNQSLPKPMTPIGTRPVLWHVMRYYAHFGHKDFILCLGHGAQAVKDYFLNYRETTSNDFVLMQGGEDVKMLSTDISEWTISFIDTGVDTAIGERLRRVRPYLDGDDIFLANYGDVLTDAPLPQLIENHRARGAVASFLCVKPGYSFHLVQTDEDDLVSDIQETTHSNLWINGGYFVFGSEIFDFIEEGEDLVEEPFQRLIQAQQLVAYRYDGFWIAVDTAKDKQRVDELYASGKPPWLVWSAVSHELSRT